MDDPVIEMLPQKQQQEQQQPQQPAEAPGLQALRLVFQDMVNAASINSSNNNEMSSSSGSSISSLNTVAVSPRVFTRALGIDIFEQQDAQEFWKLLLPALNIPALTDLYQGAFQDYIVALDGSGRERRREEPFLDLSLDVTQPPPAAATTTTMPESSSVLLSLKHMFGQPELLSKAEGNGWRPEKDADKVDAHKGSLLRTPGLPSILQLHLKRFNYDWNTETMNKINDPFSFPKELDLSCVIQDDKNDNSPNQKELAIYDLQAIVVHMGIYGQGHYYSYIRPDVRNDDWYRFDDEQVTPVSYQQVVADATGGKQPSSASAELVEPPQQQQKQHGGAGGSGPLAFLRALFRGKSSHGYGYGGRTSNAYVIQYVRRCDIPILYDNDNMHNLVDTKP
jgi:ubiquitin carboxyl-terminal hydrolase 7